jgi:hypothetical protein
MRIAPRLARPAIVAALVAATLVPVGPASAAIDPGSYYHVDAIQDYPSPYGAAGGYIPCPAGMKAVASGAASSGLRDDGVTAGLTTFDGSGVLVTAFGDAGRHLQISARCVDAAQVQDSTLATMGIRNHDGSYDYNGRATCPPGTVAYGGGGYMHQVGGPPFRADFVYASMPDANGTDWFVGALSSASLPDKELSIGTHCLPRSQFGQITTVTATDTAPADAYHYPYATLSTAAHCPTGYAAYAGGAWLHRAGSSTNATIGNLTVSNMTADDTGWFARGWTSTAGVQLTATVQCMTSAGAVVPDVVVAPDVVGFSKRVAGQRVSAAGLVPRFTGATTAPDAYVDSQTPAPGSSVASGSTVTMHLQGEPTCGPNPC